MKESDLAEVLDRTGLGLLKASNQHRNEHP